VRAGELNAFWRWGLAITGPLVRLVFRVRVSGLEHIPSTGPAIVAFNHVSALDGPVVGIEIARRLRREVRFLVAAEYFRVRSVGWILRYADQIPIRRGEGDAHALDTVIDALRHGSLTALAPEGRVDDEAGANGLQRIRSGVARIALPTGAPVIPAAIWGTQARISRKGWHFGRPFRPRLALIVGPPILPVGDLEDATDVETFLARIRDRLETQVADARALVED
jgi:1-acyl-sn-glycerol-3-phosphate acyltransferase